MSSASVPSESSSGEERSPLPLTLVGSTTTTHCMAKGSGEAGIEPAQKQVVHFETEEFSPGVALSAELAKVQSIVEHLTQEYTRLVTELQSQEEDMAREDSVHSEMPPPAPEPAQVPEPPESWTLEREQGSVPSAVGSALGQPLTPPETLRAAERPHAPAKRNARGGKRGSERALRPLHPGAVTLLVRNIPAKFTQERLLEEWPSDGTIDFLYRPCREDTGVLGHAFLNFTSNAAAAAFQRKWHGQFFRNHGKGKALDIVGSITQGYTKNLKEALRKINMLIEGDHQLPALFRDSERLDVCAEAASLGLRVPGQAEVHIAQESLASFFFAVAMMTVNFSCCCT
mmetsp:Transcript_129007/g.359192  ORF Transcript_129007/g.359192 Transcript_129007/m.359192 type:complete len:343 (+) Transcript_129007:62-1090(+)